MSDGSKIEWTDASWPLTVGCDHVSPGCDNCYAAMLTSGRLKHLPEYAGLAEHGKFNGTVRCLPERLDWPSKWRKPKRIFVCSMSDLFHELVPSEFIARVFAAMANYPQHTFQVLTKRHGRMKALLNENAFKLAVMRQASSAHPMWMSPMWPLPNVWLGVSAEDQHWAEIRVHALLQTPAAERWVSAEPLLGPIDLRNLKARNGALIDALCGDVKSTDGTIYAACPGSVTWVVAGGESGRGARPMHPDWARSLRDQCQDARVPFLFKQHGNWIGGWRADYDQGEGFHPVSDPGNRLGAWHWPGDNHPAAHQWPDGTAAMRVGKKAAGRELDGRTWDEYPRVWTAALA